MVWQIAASAGLQALGGLLGSRSAKKAARAREAAYRDASSIVDASYNAASGMFEPRADQERAAMDRVNALLGLAGEAPDFSLFRETPGYQFQLEQGTQAIERSAAARGGLASGNTLAELGRYGQGLADLTFNTYLDRVLGLQNQGVDSVLANLALGRGNALADLRLGMGGAKAGGIEGAGAAWQGALTGAANLIGDLTGGQAGGNALTPQVPATPSWTPQPPSNWRGVPFRYPTTYRGG